MPENGEIISGKELNRYPKKKYIWASCSICNKERWVECRKGKPFYNICFKCGRPKKKVWNIITTGPIIGEIRSSGQIEGYAKCKTKYIYEKCPNCGNGRWHQVHSAGKYPKCRKCMNIGKIKNKSGTWKGGRKISYSGYIYIRLYPDDPYYSMCNNSGYVFEHRLVMAKQLGRCLHDWEIVHHRDSDKQNNVPGNLFVTGTEHHNTLVEYTLKLQALKIKELEDKLAERA